jgi:hypothetical protein
LQCNFYAFFVHSSMIFPLSRQLPICGARPSSPGPTGGWWGRWREGRLHVHAGRPATLAINNHNTAAAEKWRKEDGNKRNFEGGTLEFEQNLIILLFWMLKFKKKMCFWMLKYENENWHFLLFLVYEECESPPAKIVNNDIGREHVWKGMQKQSVLAIKNNSLLINFKFFTAWN